MQARAKRAPITPDEIADLKHVYLGPTWLRGEDGGWLLPEYTLGWQIVGWCAEYLHAEDGGPWTFTKEQLRFVLWWYAVNEDGRFVHRKGVLQRMKGWGKDPLLAVLCLVELSGPSRFSHWDKDGNPVGTPHPQAWVQVTAVNQSQTSNTMGFLPILMSDKYKAEYNIKDGAEIIRANGGKQKLEAVTSSFRALEGKRTTFTLLNETHHWVSGNNGHKMYETIDGNATKRDSRYLAITNAYLPGEDSVAERMRDAFEKIESGKSVDVGLLYDSVEAHAHTPLTAEALEIVIPIIRGDAVWLSISAIIASVMDATIAPSRSRRMWLNQVVAEEDAVLGPAEWDVLTQDDRLLQPGDAITLGFDGGKSDDATALVAIRVSDMTAFPLGIWERPDGPAGEEWEVPRHEVDSEVHEAFRLFRVVAFYADVALWESYISEWDQAYAEGLECRSPLGKDAIGWDMRSSQKTSTLAHERLLRSIFDRKLAHNGDRTLRRHALNARRRTNNHGVSFGKESASSPKKVDGYAALMLAHEALVDWRARGQQKSRRTGAVYIF